jgi:hypothetical protein
VPQAHGLWLQLRNGGLGEVGREALYKCPEEGRGARLFSGVPELTVLAGLPLFSGETGCRRASCVALAPGTC